MNYRIVEKESFAVLERIETHSSAREENERSIPEFWTRARKEGTLELLRHSGCSSAPLLGICYGSGEENFAYGIGIACEGDAAVPKGLRRSLIPGGEWVVFEGTGAMPEAMQTLWHSIFSEFFPNSLYQPTGVLDVEVYPAGDMDSAGYPFQIWIPVTKKK